MLKISQKLSIILISARVLKVRLKIILYLNALSLLKIRIFLFKRGSDAKFLPCVKETEAWKSENLHEIDPNTDFF